MGAKNSSAAREPDSHHSAKRRGSGASAAKSSTTATKPKDDGISSADRATLQLKLQRDKLNVIMKRSQLVMDREEEQARMFVASHQRDKALYCLKKRRLQQQQMEHVQSMLANVQASLDRMESSRVEADVLASLREGTKILTELQKGMSPEEVEKVMDEAFDAIRLTKEITEMLGQQDPTSSAALIDDDELLAELTTGSTTTKQKVVVGQGSGAVADDSIRLLSSVAVPDGPITSAEKVPFSQTDRTEAAEEDNADAEEQREAVAA